MSYAAPQEAPVIALPEDDRIAFMAKVYQHLGLAIVAFMAFEFMLFTVGFAEWFYNTIAGSSGAWLLVLGLFMLGGWITSQSAMDLGNPGRQYAGLFGESLLYAVLFAPALHYVFNVQNSDSDVWAAAAITAIGFAGLTATAWITRRDLSFLRPIVTWGVVAAMVLIVGALLFGANLGTWFSVAMVALMGASILYQTQTILRRYPQEAYVGAAVNLFGSVMTMFYYILMIFMDR